MTPRIYRFLLVSSFVLGVAAAFLDTLFPSVLPASFVEAQEVHDGTHFMSTAGLFGAFVALLTLAVLVAATVGLYLFRPWAPRLALVATALAALASVPLGAVALSGWAMGLNELASTLWGAVLALTFFSPASKYFARADR